MAIPNAVMERISYWLSGKFDPNTKKTIEDLKHSSPQALIDAFYTDLTFGTGGLRGLMGIGPNRMNIYTVARATYGLGGYLRNLLPTAALKVVIGFDSRHQSKEFAATAAQVLAAMGIEAYLLNELRPTPFISFLCRHLHCSAAIMITASHNPPEYNGYKVYWSDGGQIVPPHDQGIIEEVLTIQHYDMIPKAPLDSPKIHPVDDTLDKLYISAIRPLQQSPETNRSFGKDLSIVFSSLHGAGITLAPKALQDWGFTNLHLVENQCIPDPDFSTVKSPNPEALEALTLGIDTVKKQRSDILFVTDPDADRLGIAVLHDNIPYILSGNQAAALAAEYLAKKAAESNHNLKHYTIVTTIVSTDLIKAISKNYHLHYEEVLTGFKYIGEKIHLWEEEKSPLHFLFGAEESYGYLAGTHARDKDAIVACCLFAEIALYAKKQGKTLVDLLYDIYRKYGVYREGQRSIELTSGQKGMETMAKMMAELRSNPWQELAGAKAVIFEDYKEGSRHDLSDDAVEFLSLPKADVLLWRFEDGSKVVVRPSGTEPKLKIYVGVKKAVDLDLATAIQNAEADLQHKLNTAKEYFLR